MLKDGTPGKHGAICQSVKVFKRPGGNETKEVCFLLQGS